MDEHNFDYLCMNCMEFKPSAAYSCPHCGFDLRKYKQEQSDYYLPPETILNGKYLVGVVLGEGALETTYLAYDLNLHTKAAIKEYCPQNLTVRNTKQNLCVYPRWGGRTEEMYFYGLRYFIDGARKLANLDVFEGIVYVRDYFEENNTAYFVMNYAEGKNLERYLNEAGGKLSVKETLGIMESVIMALGQVHRAGIFHGAVSPENIMISENGQVNLINLGAASKSAINEKYDVIIDIKHGYAPMEQYIKSKEKGPWTDVYAICATIYRCLTGYDPASAIDRIVEEQLSPLKEFGVDVDRKWENKLKKGLAVRMEERYQDMDSLYQALYSEMTVKKEKPRGR